MASNIIEVPDVETVGVEIRAYNGRECLFTTDGKLIANQIEGMGFPWIIKHNPKDPSTYERTFRVTLKIDDKLVRQGLPV